MGKSFTSKGLIFFLVIGLPLISSELALDPGLTTRFVALSLVCLVMSIILICKWKGVKKTKPLTISILVVYFVYILYMLLRVSGKYVFADSLFEWIKMSVYFTLCVLIYQLYNFKLIRDNLILSLSVLGLILAFWGIIDLFQVVHMGQLTIPKSTYNIMACFEHRNLFAQVLLLSLPFQLIQTVEQKDKYTSSLFILSATLSFFLVFVLFNRAVWLATFIAFSVPVLVFFILRRRKFTVDASFLLPYIVRTGITLFAALILGFTFIQTFTNHETVSSHTKEILNVEKGTGKDRLELWSRTYKMFQEDPVVGKGLANWKIEVLKYSNEGLTSEDNSTFYQRPHNDYLWILSESGLPGLGLYLLLIILILMKMYCLITNSSNQKDFLFLIAMIISMTAFLIYSFFSFPRERIVQNVILIFFVASVILFEFKQKESKNQSIRKYLLIIISTSFVLVSVLGIGIGMFRFIGEFHTKKALNAKTDKNYDRINHEIDMAENFFYRMDPISTPLSWYSGFAYYQMENPALANQFFREALSLNPYHIHVLNNLASSYALLKQIDSALIYYKQAVNIAPNFDESWFNMAAIYYNQEEYSNAYEALKSINLFTTDPRYKPFIKTIIKAMIYKLIAQDGTLMFKKLPENEEWYFEVHKQLRNENKLLKNLIFEDQILAPDK